VIETRSEIVGADRNLERLVTEIENAIDELEQAAFLASLVPLEVPPELLEPLADLSAAGVVATEAAAAGAAAAGEIPAGHHADTEDALAAVGRLIEVEHKADAAERRMTARIMTGEYTIKSALPVLELARALERSTDRLATFGHLLHEHVLADLAA